MKNITESAECLRNINGGGIVTSFLIGFVLKRAVVEAYNYYYSKK